MCIILLQIFWKLNGVCQKSSKLSKKQKKAIRKMGFLPRMWSLVIGRSFQISCTLHQTSFKASALEGTWVSVINTSSTAVLGGPLLDRGHQFQCLFITLSHMVCDQHRFYFMTSGSPLRNFLIDL